MGTTIRGARAADDDWDELLPIIDRLGQPRVMVIGDVMLDRYYYGTLLPSNPEGLAPNIDVQEMQIVPGGAANAARNVRALGAFATLFGIRGDDYAGHELQDLCAKTFADQSSNSWQLFIDPERPTTIKERIISQDPAGKTQTYHVRINIERKHDISRAIAGLVLERAVPLINFGHFNGLYLSDYAKGALTPYLTNELISHAHQTHVPVMVDPKPEHADLYHGADIIKVNWKEAGEILSASGLALPAPEHAPQETATLDALATNAVRKLRDRFACATAVLTFGKHGVWVSSGTDEVVWNPAYARHAHGQAGAGDTFGATYFLSHLAGATPAQAARIASYAAGCAVEQHGTTTITRDALKKYIEEYAP